MLDIWRNFGIMHFVDAGVAHLVERHLAKVEVASSSLVTRSKKRTDAFWHLFFFCAGRGSNHLNATVRWTVARRRLDDGDTIIFFRLRKKMQTSLVTR